MDLWRTWSPCQQSCTIVRLNITSLQPHDAATHSRQWQARALLAQELRLGLPATPDESTLGADSKAL